MPAKRTCKTCRIDKTTEDFYSSNLSRCKECIKRCNKLYSEIKTSTPEGMESERARHRDKYQRLGYKEKQKEWNENQPWKQSSTYKGLRRRYPELDSSFELHHWNYNDDYLTDVFILERSPHKVLHTNMTLDLKTKIFTTKSGEILDTRDKHEVFIESLCIKIYQLEETKSNN